MDHYSDRRVHVPRHHPGRRRRNPPVAAVAEGPTEVPARPRGHGPHADPADLGPDAPARRRPSTSTWSPARGTAARSPSSCPSSRTCARAVASRLDAGDRPGRRDHRASRPGRRRRLVRRRPRIPDAALRRQPCARRRGAEQGTVVTIGITPHRPPRRSATSRRVTRSRAAPRARGASSSRSPTRRRPGATWTGRLVWNAGMFVRARRVLLDSLARSSPPCRGLRAIAAVGQAERRGRAGRTWPTLTRSRSTTPSPSRSPLEGGMAVVPGHLRLGRPRRLRAIARPGPSRLAVGGRRRRGPRPRRACRSPSPGRERRRGPAPPTPCSCSTSGSRSGSRKIVGALRRRGRATCSEPRRDPRRSRRPRQVPTGSGVARRTRAV